jgi:fibro-slime domain-containing protein
VNTPLVSTLRLSRQADGSYVFDDPTFFPLDEAGWVALGKEPLRNDGSGVPRNFSFTSETRYWFEYKGQEVLSFRGDDDVWVFINGHLAVDLGGVHGPVTGSVTLSQRATEFGLRVGGIYEAVVFQAERHTAGSSYRLTLTDFVTRRTECLTTCGDGIVQEGEECDDGVNDGDYGQCFPGCLLGERCGDGQRQAEEQCDDRNTQDGDGCSATCTVEFG